MGLFQLYRRNDGQPRNPGLWDGIPFRIRERSANQRVAARLCAPSEMETTPTAFWSRSGARGGVWAATALRLGSCLTTTHGSSFLPTLGFQPDSTWDSLASPPSLSLPHPS